MGFEEGAQFSGAGLEPSTPAQRSQAQIRANTEEWRILNTPGELERIFGQEEADKIRAQVAQKEAEREARKSPEEKLKEFSDDWIANNSANIEADGNMVATRFTADEPTRLTLSKYVKMSGGEMPTDPVLLAQLTENQRLADERAANPSALAGGTQRTDTPTADRPTPTGTSRAQTTAAVDTEMGEGVGGPTDGTLSTTRTASTTTVSTRNNSTRSTEGSDRGNDGPEAKQGLAGFLEMIMNFLSGGDKGVVASNDTLGSGSLRVSGQNSVGSLNLSQQATQHLNDFKGHASGLVAVAERTLGNVGVRGTDQMDTSRVAETARGVLS